MLNLYSTFHQLAVVLSDFKAGVLPLGHLIGQTHQHRFTEFVSWLEALEVYGSGYDDDVEMIKYRKRENEDHWQDAIKQLQGI